MNSNPQAINTCDFKLRPLADRLGQVYNVCKALQAEAAANGWATLFPNDAQVIADTAAVDGRAVITNADIFQLIAVITSFLGYMEATSNANRNLVMKIGPNTARI
jgi:hypothetical protein